MPNKKSKTIKLHGVVCGKCGHVWLKYIGPSRAAVTELREMDDEAAIKNHDIHEHKDDGRFYMTRNVVFQGKAVLRP